MDLHLCLCILAAVLASGVLVSIDGADESVASAYQDDDRSYMANMEAVFRCTTIVLTCYTILYTGLYLFHTYVLHEEGVASAILSANPHLDPGSGYIFKLFWVVIVVFALLMSVVHAAFERQQKMDMCFNFFLSILPVPVILALI
jgi:hypothetical protein